MVYISYCLHNCFLVPEGRNICSKITPLVYLNPVGAIQYTLILTISESKILRPAGTNEKAEQFNFYKYPAPLGQKTKTIYYNVLKIMKNHIENNKRLRF